MKSLTIQLRITAWYLATTALILGLFAAGTWYAMRASMLHTVDRDLIFRIRQVVPFIEEHELNNRDRFQRAFSSEGSIAVLGVFIQVTNDKPEVVFESSTLQSHEVPAMAAASVSEATQISTVGRWRQWPIRVASKHIVAGGVPLTIHLVQPLRDMLVSQGQYTTYLALLLTIALILASTTAYSVSRHALAPVENIRREAEAINPEHLSARLPLPPTDDELKRLAQTLNAMLARIEGGFHAVQQFTADASHELRAPLALILTATEVTLRRQRSPEALEDALLTVQREARHMKQLIEQLLALARNDARQSQTRFGLVDVARMTRDTMLELQLQAERKGLDLVSNIEAGEIFTYGDHTQIRRLLLLLLDNALKYTEAGKVSVSLAVRGRTILLEVSDTGIGIESFAIPKIFNRFWRADQVRSRVEGGNGLGLALASQIAAQHKATIAVASQFGRGSTFLVTLPLKEPDAVFDR